jgi:hypothetical protein
MPAAAAEPAAPGTRTVARGQAPPERRAQVPEPALAWPAPPPAVPPVLAPPLQALRPRAVRPTPLPARAAPERRAPRATSDVVQVRIGRIEVRATIARAEHPAPAATRAPRARPLSLEAFLEGRRRS